MKVILTNRTKKINDKMLNDYGNKKDKCYLKKQKLLDVDINE